MKRFLSTLLVAMLIVTSLATYAFAAGTATVTISDSSKHEPGDQVTLTVTVSGAFANYELYLESELEIVSISGVQHNLSTGKVAFATDSNISSHSFKVTVKVPADAKKCSYNVDARVLFVSDENLEDQNVSVNDGTVSLNHAWDDGVVTAKPDCDTYGEMTYTCTRCGAKKTERIEKTAHNWSDWTVTDEAKCNKEGSKTRTCSICGKVDTQPIEKTQHNWSDWTVISEGNCTEDGSKTRSCSICGEVETVFSTAPGHAWAEGYIADEQNHWRVCTVCEQDSEHEKHTFDEVEDHHFVCNVCGWDYWNQPDDPEIDDEPKPGDITFEITLGVVTLLAMLAAAAYAVMRKRAK